MNDDYHPIDKRMQATCNLEALHIMVTRSVARLLNNTTKPVRNRHAMSRHHMLAIGFIWPLLVTKHTVNRQAKNLITVAIDMACWIIEINPLLNCLASTCHWIAREIVWLLDTNPARNLIAGDHLRAKRVYTVV